METLNENDDLGWEDDHQDGGLELSFVVDKMLDIEFPNRLQFEEYEPDSVHLTAPGRTIFLDNLSGITLREYASGLVEALASDVRQQLEEQGRDPLSPDWAITHEWLCHLIYEVEEESHWRGRFDIAIRVVDRALG